MSEGFFQYDKTCEILLSDGIFTIGGECYDKK